MKKIDSISLRIVAALTLCLSFAACGGSNPVTIGKPDKQVNGTGKPSAASTNSMQELVKELKAKESVKKSLSPKEIADILDKSVDNLADGGAGEVKNFIDKMREYELEFDPAQRSFRFRARGGDVSGNWLQVEGKIDRELKSIASITERLMKDKKSRTGETTTRQPGEQKRKEMWGACFGDCNEAILIISELNMMYPIYIRSYSLSKVADKQSFGVSTDLLRSFQEQANADGGEKAKALLETEKLEILQVIHPYSGRSIEVAKAESGGERGAQITFEKPELKANRSGAGKLCLRVETAPFCSDAEQNASQQ